MSEKDSKKAGLIPTRLAHLSDNVSRLESYVDSLLKNLNSVMDCTAKMEGANADCIDSSVALASIIDEIGIRVQNCSDKLEYILSSIEL